MKISVIIPVYNTKKEYLRECLNSLTAQQEFEGYEIIAVNDGSTNGCEKVIREFALKYDNVVHVDQENGGTSEARNTGLKHSRGEYIMFVDADDYVSPDSLKTVYAAMKKRQVDILFFGYATNYSNREMNRVLKDPDPALWDREVLELSVLKGNPSLGPVDVGAPWGKLIKANIIRDNGLKYTKGLIKGQDTVFMLSLFQHCNSFSYLKYLGYHYRISESSVSRRYNPDIVDIMEKTLGAYGDFVDKYDKNEEFKEAVRQKYYKVLMGEYPELYFLNKKNTASETEKEKGFRELLEREPYRGVIGKLDPKKAGFISGLQIRFLKEKNVKALFAMKRAELMLKYFIVHKYY